MERRDGTPSSTWVVERRVAGSNATPWSITACDA